jgi:hypothetical protein
MSSMRLNKYDKEAFVAAVMADIPMIDYDEQAKNLVQKAAYEAMPAKVKAVYQDKDTRQFLKTGFYHHSPGCLQNFYIYMPQDWKHGDDLDKQLRELEEAKVEQEVKRNDMKAKLTGIINSCNTLKQAKELLPEFEKYLPEERQQTKSLPAVSGLVADLTKLGWPKGKKPESVAA